MERDILPDLLKEVQDKFEASYGKSEVVRRAFEELKKKRATYATANDFALEVGDILADALSSSVTGDKLPDGKMYYNIAQRLLTDTLGRNFELVSGYAGQVQEDLNRSAKIGLQVQVPEINQDRIDGLVNRLSSEDEFSKVAWMLQEPIVNFTQSIVDDSIKANAEFHYDSGLSPQIIRKEGGKCCDWCREVVGIYQYPKVPKDAYRRHQRCRCTVDYDPKNGKIQDIWSKLWRKQKKQEEAEKRVSEAVFSEGVLQLKKDIAKINMTTATPNDIIEIGKRINYHFNVSEHIGNNAKLKEIFSNFRDIGGEIPKEVWAKGSSKVVKDQLQNAFSYYPKEWAKIPQKHGKQLSAIKRKRGYFSGYDVNLVIATNGVRQSTPFHEIGHLVEWATPDLVRLEKAWVDQRTVGEMDSRLKDIFPGSSYGPREVTKKDDFVDPYIGKYYRDAAEVFTMGLQGIFVPEELFVKSYNRQNWSYEKKTINDDPEFLNFIIGLFVKV
ncbi:TPA: hypothetical protein U2D03_001734 [Streptococcus suis]|nr:hypothetical protein [Streptococcus suis]